MSAISSDWLKLIVYVVALVVMAVLSYRGVLPRTRPIMPGELMISG
jgi:hypothetical protein